MDRLLTSLCLVSVLAAAPAVFADEPTSAEIFARAHLGRLGGGARHMILDPQHALRDEERAALAEMGVTVQRPLANGRLLVRVAAGSSFDENDPRVRTLEPLTAALKIHETARREARTLRATGHFNVWFHDDVSLDAAKQAIEAAGGVVDQPLQIDFDIPRAIPARVPVSALESLASDERVLVIRGRWRFPMAGDNSISAQLSRVDQIHAAPYGLTGQGVSLSMFELAPIDSSHPEFGGRVTVNFGPCSAHTNANYSLSRCNTDAEHATHVAGTMLAAGTGAPRAPSGASAKGMAPGATLTQYTTYPGQVNSISRYLSDKKNKLPPLGVVADNNSWGYVVGWTGSPPLFDGSYIYYGAYDGEVTGPLDMITRASNVLFVHSAGNDGTNKFGPTSFPYAHRHVDNEGDVIEGQTFCYSADGTGTDCPVPTCSAGPAFCELDRHPFTIPCGPATGACTFGTIGVTASAKSSIAVGAVDASKDTANYSSRGPTRDGRVKPDLVSRGGVGTTTSQVFSTRPGGQYGGDQGTSMASPVVTGIAALFVEQYRKSFAGATPTPDIIKTTLIAGAEDRGNPGPDYTYGFGLVDAKAAVDLLIADSNTGSRIKVASMANGDTLELPVTIPTTQNFRVVLGWSDPEVLYLTENELGLPAIVNDLDLKVIDPSGNTVLPYVLDKNQASNPATRGVNSVDTTEEVEIANAAPGKYRVIVSGTRITAASPQRVVVVSNGPIGDAVLPCTDIREPNDTTATAFGYLVDNELVNAKLCSASDVDNYKFRVTAGAVSVVVTATDTPLRATLSSSATTTVTVDVPAGASRTLSTNYGGSQPVEMFLEVKPLNSTIGADASYTVKPAYTFNSGTRRRSTRH